MYGLWSPPAITTPWCFHPPTHHIVIKLYGGPSPLPPRPVQWRLINSDVWSCRLRVTFKQRPVKLLARGWITANSNVCAFKRTAKFQPNRGTLSCAALSSPQLVILWELSTPPPYPRHHAWQENFKAIGIFMNKFLEKCLTNIIIWVVISSYQFTFIIRELGVGTWLACYN